LLSLSLTTLANAATYYVDQNASSATDTNPGTKERPCKTIQAGVEKLAAGDTLLISPGIYRETVTVTKSGTEDKPIVIAAEKKGTVTVRGSQVVSDWKKSGEDAHIWVHDGWDKSFGAWTEEAIKGGDTDTMNFSSKCSWNQLFVNGALLKEVACKERRGQGTFYVDKGGKQVHLWPSDDKDPRASTVEITDRARLFVLEKARHVHLKGLAFEHCANAAQQGAVTAKDGAHNLIEDCSVQFTAGAGIELRNQDRTVLRRCLMNSNGQEGLGADRCQKLLIEDSETSNNNRVPGKTINPFWESGAFKVCRSLKTRFVRHQAHGNLGPMWFDISNDESEVANSFVSGNLCFAGVQNEVSFAIHVHDCVLVNNMGGGIGISESPEATIERNILIDNDQGGVRFRDLNRGCVNYYNPKWGPLTNKVAHCLRGARVVNNVFFNNRDAQVFFASNLQKEFRTIPMRLLQPEVLTKQFYAWTRDKDDTPLPIGLCLETLGMTLNNNVYWSDKETPLAFWGSINVDKTSGVRNAKTVLSHADIHAMRSRDGLEKDGVVMDPQFADWKKLDLRIPKNSPLMKMGCYPKGEVPGVKLGVME
jgi:hypothetical protein